MIKILKNKRMLLMTEEEKKDLLKEISKTQKDAADMAKLKHTLFTVIMTVVVILTAVISYKISAKLHTKKEPDIDIAFVNAKLENISELATEELVYTGILMYSDGTIPFITQTGFSMLYTADVKAGVDLSQMDIDVTDTQVLISIPHAKILSINVDPDSIHFYDEMHALFNWSQKYDVTEALTAAESDVKDKVVSYDLITKAEEQAEIAITDILEGTIGERELVISYIEDMTQ